MTCSSVNSEHRDALATRQLKWNELLCKYRPRSKQSKTAKIRVGSLGYNFQSDLFVFPDLSRHNGGFKYIVVICDCFSHRVFAKALKRKTGKELAEVMDEFFSDITKRDIKAPVSLLGTDLGTEFWNEDCETVYKSHQVITLHCAHR